jgi:arginyl-tRNA synthetase
MPVRDPIASLERVLAGVAGAPVELDRPADPAHGDYATNVALRLAGGRRLPPRDVATELAEQIDGLDGLAGV